MTSTPSLDVFGLVIEQQTSELRPEYRDAEGVLGPSCFESVTKLSRADDLPADVQQALGIVLGHFGLSEGDRIAVRFQSADEQRAELARIMADLELRQAQADAARVAAGVFGVNVEIAANGACLALRDAEGRIVGEPDDVDEDGFDVPFRFSDAKGAA